MEKKYVAVRSAYESYNSNEWMLGRNAAKRAYKKIGWGGGGNLDEVGTPYQLVVTY